MFLKFNPSFNIFKKLFKLPFVQLYQLFVFPEVNEDIQGNGDLACYVMMQEDPKVVWKLVQGMRVNAVDDSWSSGRNPDA
jgi:hypothetical protein